MALQLSQVMRQTQRLVMTPQMQQSIKLLQMNSMELEQHLDQELLENPFLEVAEDGEEEDQLGGHDEALDGEHEGGDTAASDPSANGAGDAESREQLGMGELDLASEVMEREAPPSPSEESALGNGTLEPTSDAVEQPLESDTPAAVDVEWDQVYDDAEPRLLAATREHDVEDSDFTSYTASRPSLYDQLKWQLAMSTLSGKRLEMAEHIIGLIDDDGYFRTPLSDVAEEFGMELADAEDVLAVIQSFEPPGLGARNISECLILQMEAMDQKDRDYYKVVNSHFDHLQSKKFREIARDTGIPEAKVTEIFHYVSKLNPKPGHLLAPHQPNYIRPDVYVKEVDGEYLYYLNEGRSGLLRVNHYYRDLLTSTKTGLKDADREFASGKFKSAVWLIKNIEKRKETVLRVTEAIMDYQREFLDKGIEHLRPLTLKTIAGIVGMHESTIARVTTGKYVETPRGTFELKFFFSSALETDSGEDASSRAIKDKIKQIVAGEPPRKPLSDQKIANMLQADGIKIARRTVAKYREQLKILPAKLRKSV